MSICIYTYVHIHMYMYIMYMYMDICIHHDTRSTSTSSATYLLHLIVNLNHIFERHDTYTQTAGVAPWGAVADF